MPERAARVRAGEKWKGLAFSFSVVGVVAGLGVLETKGEAKGERYWWAW